MNSRKSLTLLLLGIFTLVTIASARGPRRGGTPITPVITDPVVIVSPN